MPDALARLPYRTRLVGAMIGAALVPLLALAVFLGGLMAILRDEEDHRLGGAALAVAGQLQAASLDDATASSIARQTGFAVALYDGGGALVASSDPESVAGALPSAPPTARAAFAHGGGTTSAFARIAGPSGAARGYVELASPEAGPLGMGLDLSSIVTLALGLAIALALLIGWMLARVMVRPLGSLSAAVARLGTGDLDARLPVEGADELAAVAASHNRLADALAARNRSLGLVLSAIAELTPREGVDALLSAAPAAAAKAFGFTGVEIELSGPESGPPSTVVEDHVPGEPWRFPTLLRAGGERIGTLWTTIPPTREWGQADQHLLELFAIELGAAIRNAQLFAEVERLSEMKSEFLRGVSHNLQTPLTSIRALAAQLAEEPAGNRPRGARGRKAGTHADPVASVAPDRRLAIIVEQSERLSRLVEQLLTVSRLEAGTLRPKVEVFAPGPLVARAWESLRQGDRGFRLRDDARGWLAAADRDRVDQVVWALLDNARKYGRRPIEATIRPAEEADTLPPGAWLVVAIRDHGPGIPPEDRARAFERFTRLGGTGAGGTGLGLSVARGLVEAMGGRLWIPETDGTGTTFAFSLPAEPVGEP